MSVLGDVPSCARLIDASGLLEETPGIELPAGDTVGDWQAGFLGQSGQLEKSNIDKTRAKRLGETCETMHRDALVKAKRPWWKFWR